MDTIARRSAALATAIHACLLAVAFMPHGCSQVPDQRPPPPAAELPAPAGDATPAAAPTYGALVAAPLASAAAAPPLPALSADDLPALPDPAQPISAANQDRATGHTARGRGDGERTQIELPALPVHRDDLLGRLDDRRTSNEELNREQRMLATAQEFLHGRLQGQIERSWRHLLKQVTEHRLIIEIRVDRRGRPTLAHLVNSSGSLALDRLVEEWLNRSDFNLPPITPEVVYPFLIVLRR
jgi:outer membrane biosynthesis protein TonB